MSNIPVVLPMGDVFRPYEFEENGDIKQRQDTLTPQENSASKAASRSPDVAAILMAENMRLQAEAAAQKSAE